MSIENDVRKASEEFYAALNRVINGDAGPLADIWLHNATVTTMRLVRGWEVGWDAVRETFEKIAAMASNGNIELSDQIIRVAGDMACEVGIEHAQFKLGGQQFATECRVTNLYQHDGGAWKVIHHHTDIPPAIMDVIG